MSRGAALVLAVVFAWSSLAKLVTQPDMTALGLPSSTANAVSLVEVVVAVALLLSSTNGGLAALVVLAGFTTFLLRRVNRGASCACFGASAAPVTWWSIARNAVLLALAAVAAFA
ncbi:MAG: Methylamine utilization protein MauE [Actinomycetota bacterium]|nr:Methylamine utilization protein MauE [Actinomycetota bacterium]